MAETPFQWAMPGGLNNQIVNDAIASAATIAPTRPIVPITGTAEITTITVPWPGFAGFIVLLPAGASTLNTGGNIAKAYTMVAATALILVYNPAAGLWYPHSVT